MAPRLRRPHRRLRAAGQRPEREVRRGPSGRTDRGHRFSRVTRRTTNPTQPTVIGGRRFPAIQCPLKSRQGDPGLPARCSIRAEISAPAVFSPTRSPRHRAGGAAPAWPDSPLLPGNGDLDRAIDSFGRAIIAAPISRSPASTAASPGRERRAISSKLSPTSTAPSPKIEERRRPLPSQPVVRGHGRQRARRHRCGARSSAIRATLTFFAEPTGASLTTDYGSFAAGDCAPR